MRGRRSEIDTRRFLDRNYIVLLKKISRSLVIFVGPLIPLFWTFGAVCPEFQTRMDPLSSVLCYLHAIDSSDSPLVRHLLTS